MERLNLEEQLAKLSLAIAEVKRSTIAKATYDSPTVDLLDQPKTEMSSATSWINPQFLNQCQRKLRRR